MADDLHYSSRSDNKRKFDSQVGPTSPAAPTSGRRPSGFSAPIFSTPTSAAAPPCYKSVAPPLDGIELAKQRAQEIAARLFSDAEAKRPRVENGGGADDSSNKGYSFDQPQNPFGQPLSSQAGMTAPSFAPYGYPGSSKKIDVPNGRVGVIIGKSGETIKYLQVQSGARIQVTRDMDADPNSQSRPVELIGTPEQISKAEQLISDVLAEAEAGGSGIVSRKFSSPPTAADHFSMKVPNNKVGLIIGKGGETIKNMQASSGARIQVIPLHLPPGDMSNERTVHIDGTTEQIESAKQLVNEVISENRPRISQSGGFRPPRPQTGWDQSMQQPGYGYMQPGAYSVQPPQYNMPQPLYGWDQSANPSNQQTTQVTGYDYYNQQQLPQQQQNVAASSAPADTNSYSYSQIPTPYSAPGSYTDPSYSQSITGQQQGYAQSGSYVQPAPQAGYAQPTYGSVSAYSNSTASAQDGSSAPAATQQAPPSTAQQAYTQQGNTGYANQSGYPQSPQGQKPPPAQPAYGQTQQTVSSQAAYAQLAQAYAQTSQVYSQPGYAPVSSHAPGAYGQSYAQQQQQPYNDSYAGAYGQPSYSSDATHVAYEAAQNAPGGAAKASPQS